MAMFRSITIAALIAFCDLAFGTMALADTVKRTIIPTEQRIHATAGSLPIALREPYMIGMFNLIFTHHPDHGDAVVGFVLSSYSTRQIIARGRAVQSGDAG